MVSVLPGSTASVMYQVTMQSWHQMGQHSSSDSSSSNSGTSTGSGIQDSGRTVLQAWSAHARHASLLRFLLTEQVATHEVTDCRFGAVVHLPCSLTADMHLPASVSRLDVMGACCCIAPKTAEVSAVWQVHIKAQALQAWYGITVQHSMLAERPNSGLTAQTSPLPLAMFGPAREAASRTHRQTAASDTGSTNRAAPETCSAQTASDAGSLKAAASDTGSAQTAASDSHYARMLLQRALHSWHAVVLHMADCRVVLHQALKSADNAIKTGCQAAAADSLSWSRLSVLGSQPIMQQSQHSAQLHQRSPHVGHQSAGVAAVAKGTAAVTCPIPGVVTAAEPRHEAAAASLPSQSQPTMGVRHTDVLQQVTATGCYGTPHLSSSQRRVPPMILPERQSAGPAARSSTDFAQAQQHYFRKLLKRSFGWWQEDTQRAVALLYQQHERKACVNEEMLQV